ncbi:MAG TPA: UDP-glucuronic acid decarboxylase family protein [Streptosporangiaceae bacterium]
MRVLVTGGAGFVGSHLSEALLARGDSVICADDLSSGSLSNIDRLAGGCDFEFVHADVSAEFTVPGPVDVVAHLASPASPPDYLARPLETLAVGSRGTENALRIAHQNHARFILASTSEVYGDPAVHPQPEEYWGNVNPVGPRSVYDEAKRFAEALTVAYGQVNSVNTGIIRIFNTYGPRMRGTDGRVVTTFISQALAGEPLTVFGDGSQTRSFCYIDDLVRGILLMIDGRVPGPVNLGNPQEMSVASLAARILQLTGSSSPVVSRPLPTDDPVRRRPAIGLARDLLGWAPRIGVEDGLGRTIEWFRSGAPALCDAS